MNNKERRVLIKIIKLLALIHHENVQIMRYQMQQSFPTKKAEEYCKEISEAYDEAFTEILNESIYGEDKNETL